jgi:arylsulfatase A-like enzyme
MPEECLAPSTALTHTNTSRGITPLLLATAILLIAVTAGLGDAVRAHAAAAQPNILFIVTDDQRTDEMDVMPKTKKWFKTGDAANGIAGGTEYTQGFVTNPLCCPSRASILSGRYPHNHGVRANDEAGNFDTDRAVNRYLGDAGYRTGIFGKFLNDWDLSRNPPNWDRWAITPGAVYKFYGVNEQGTLRSMMTQYSTSYLEDQAINFINQGEANDSQPWFMYLTPAAPHNPETPDTVYADVCNPPGPFQKPPNYREADRSDKPVWVSLSNPISDAMLLGDETDCNPAGIRTERLRTLMSVDDMVEGVFQALRANGEDQDTLAVFISDNGYEFSEHGLAAGKGYPYTESVKVPLYARWPAHPTDVPQNQNDSRLAANVDLAPTALAAAGVAAPSSPPMDGRSILATASPRDRLLLEFNHFTAYTTWPPPWASLRTATYQYTEYYEEDGVSVQYREYYDLVNDPWQLTNLLGDSNTANDPSPALLATLSDQLRRDRLCSGLTCPPGQNTQQTSDTSAPSVRFVLPAPNSHVNGRVKLTAAASDNLGVAGVVLKVDGVPQVTAEDTTSPYEVVWDPSPGTHLIEGLAYDDSRNEGRATMSVTRDGFGVQTANSTASGSTPGKIEAGDKVIYSFDQAMSPSSFVSGWNGSCSPCPTVQAKITNDDPFQGSNDSFSVPGTLNNSLGTIDLGLADYIGGNRTFPTSTIAISSDRKTVTVTLGGTTPAVEPRPFTAHMTWTTSSSAKTLGNQSICTCKVLESLAPSSEVPDREF